MIPNRLNSDNNNSQEMACLTFTRLVVAVVDKPFVTFVVITFECSIQVAIAAVTSAGCKNIRQASWNGNLAVGVDICEKFATKYM